MPRNRFADALAINNGAGNLVAISRSLKDAAWEAQEEHRSTEAAWRDPAVRLIAHQIGYLTETGRILDLDDYNKLVEECKRRSQEPEKTD